MTTTEKCTINTQMSYIVHSIHTRMYFELERRWWDYGTKLLQQKVNKECIFTTPLFYFARNKRAL